MQLNQHTIDTFVSLKYFVENAKKTYDFSSIDTSIYATIDNFDGSQKSLIHAEISEIIRLGNELEMVWLVDDITPYKAEFLELVAQIEKVIDDIIEK